MLLLSFGLSGVLLVISLSLKTLLLSLKVMLKTGELTLKAAGKVSADVGLDIQDTSVAKAVRKTRDTATKTVRGVNKARHTVVNTAKTTVKTAKVAGKTTVKTAKAAGKTAKFLGKAGMKAGKLTVQAIKLTIRAIQMLIHLIHTAVVFLLSLGVVGIVILIVVLLFLVAAIAGALASVSVVPGGGFAVVGSGGAGGMPPMLGGGTGIYGGGSSGGVFGGGNFGGQQPGGVTVVQPGDTQALYSACQKMANWYLSHVTTYSAPSTKYYTCDIMPTDNKKVGDSCAYFASAYASLVSGTYLCHGSSSQWYADGVDMEKKLIAAGWRKYTTTDIGGVAGLQPGDILVCSKKTDSLSIGGHCEVYLGPKQSFGWGKVQSKFPSNTTQLTDVEKTGSGGQKLIYIAAGASHHYGRIWRYAGG